jgi:tetratricopeptide (TPR) repeat protein
VDAANMVSITGTPEQQIQWGRKGIVAAEAGQVTGWLGPLWNNLGATYEELGRYEESLAAYRQAREYHWRYGDERNKLIADWAVGHAYRLQGDFEQAGRWLRPVLAWCERIDENEFTGWCCQELGEIALAQGRNQAALQYFIRAERCLKEEQMPDWDPEGYQELIEQIDRLRSKTAE